jgi:hypothetical protein
MIRIYFFFLPAAAVAAVGATGGATPAAILPLIVLN